MPIKILDKEIVAQIAAGEVVERPASVVKELVENSLDAGSSQISVEVMGGGVSLIRVTDNGCGIPASEVGLAFERHATSKIANLNDLNSIKSLGFRGEALPSIAAVAQVELSTSAAEERVGTYLSLKDGVIIARRNQGRPQGTTVTVRNLFGKIPARLKFLKSVATENSRIASVVSQYALAFPEVKFSLAIDGRVALRTSGSGQLIDAIAQVYGAEVVENMVEIRDTPLLPPKVTGMVGLPRVSRSGRNYLSLFVNRRWVTSRLLARAVEEAYHGLLMVGRHPTAVLNVLLPPEEVDVNIHPTKSEVRFRSEYAVFSAVQRAVQQALAEQVTVPETRAMAEETVSSPPRQAIFTLAAESSYSPPIPTTTSTKSLPVLRVIGQLDNTYIIAEGPDGLYLIDQHAAHERILFERVKQERFKKEVEVQGLLEPMTLEVSPRQEVILLAHCQDLAEFGFSIEPFGERTFLVRAVPALVYDRDWVGLVRELLDSLPSEGGGDWVEGIALSLACHSAVRARQPLSEVEMRELVRQLEQSATPHTCPHGRPTIIHLSSRQLKKEFGRA